MRAVAPLDRNRFLTNSPRTAAVVVRAGRVARRVTGPLAQLAPHGIIMFTVW